MIFTSSSEAKVAGLNYSNMNNKTLEVWDDRRRFWLKNSVPAPCNVDQRPCFSNRPRLSDPKTAVTWTFKEIAITCGFPWEPFIIHV